MTYAEWLSANGLPDTPERSELWHKRYSRPAPPEGLLTSYAEIVRNSQ